MSSIVGERARVRTAFEQPTLSLLHQGHAATVIAGFRTIFSRDVPVVPAPRLHAMVDSLLDELRLAGVPDKDVPAGSGRDLCRKWLTGQWLIRSLAEDGGEQYSLTSHAQDALRLVEQLMKERTTLSEHRISTILEQARRFNRAANPDRAARVSILDSDIARLTEERDRLNAGGDMDAVDADYMLQGFAELTALVAGLPPDFARVSESFTSLRDQIFLALRGEERPAGEIIDEYLRRAETLEEATQEGRAFKGAFDLLRDQALVEQLREDMAALLEHPLAAEILTDADRGELRGTVSLISQGLSRVIGERSRATSALREFIVTHDLTRDRQVDSTLRALESEIVTWMQEAGPNSKVGVSLVPPQIEVSLMRERFHDSSAPTPPPQLVDATEHRPEELSMRDLLMQGGPSLEALRPRLKELGKPLAPVTAGALFHDLPDELRRPVEIFGVLHLAANLEFLAVHEDDEVYEALRPDGSTRFLMAARVAPPLEPEQPDRRGHPQSEASAGSESANGSRPHEVGQ